MTTILKMRGLALALLGAACVTAVAPVAALAQPYNDGGRADGGDRYDSQQAQREQYDRARRDYNGRYGEGAYEHYYPDPDRQTRQACLEEKKGNEVGGAILGGIAGAVIGSNVARGGGREGGAIIGGVGGAALGANIAKDSTHCESGR